MQPKPTFGQRLRYQFDNLMAAGTPAMIGMLAVLSLLIVLLGATAISVGGLTQPGESEPLSFGEAAWASLMRAIDSGTVSGDNGTLFRAAMLFVTVGGIFVVSTLIGVLGAGVQSKLEELRKGHSKVLESGHTVILGWTPQIFTILPELIEANSNQKKPVIVILADKDKVVMEDELRARIPDRRNTKIICRSGAPIDPTELDIASPQTARAIIALPPEEEDADSVIIKTVLAITNNPNRRPEPYTIVTEINSPKTQEVIRLIGSRDHVLAVQVDELIARITAQTARQSGLSVVYSELLDFGGDEIYFKEEAALVGKTYGEALLAYAESAVIGLYQGGRLTLNPPADTRIAAGDRLIAISADDDTIRLAAMPAGAIEEKAITSARPAQPAKPESTLLVGWNDGAAIMARELDSYVAEGSRLTVVCNPQLEEAVRAAGQDLKAMKLRVIAGDSTHRPLLDSLQAAEYDHVIVVADQDLPVQTADARTLITLLHMRDIAERDETPFSIVSEMLDMRNRELAEAARVDDFIVSDHLISLMLAQLSENRDLYDVFTDLFDPEGVEIYLKPAEDYVELGQPVNFYTVVEAARRRNATAIGYRISDQARDAEHDYGVRTNPPKGERVTFGPQDRIIVLAED